LFDKHSHPVNLITKGSLITRDIDLLASLASRRLCPIAISLSPGQRQLGLNL